MVTKRDLAGTAYVNLLVAMERADRREECLRQAAADLDAAEESYLAGVVRHVKHENTPLRQVVEELRARYRFF